MTIASVVFDPTGRGSERPEGSVSWGEFVRVYPQESARLLFGLHIVVALCWLTLLALWVRRGRGERWPAVIGVGVAATACLGISTLDVSVVPIRWLTPLQEGLTEVAVRQTQGGGGHAGVGWSRTYQWLFAPPPRDLRDVVLMNLGLVVVAASGIAVAGRRLAASTAMGLVLAGVLLLSPIGRAAVTSEGPTPALMMLSVLAILPLAFIGPTHPRVHRLLGMSTLVGLGLATAVVRPEMAVLPLCAVAIAALRSTAGDAALVPLGRAGVRRLQRGLGWMRRHPWRALAVVGVMGMTYPLTLPDGVRWGQSAWVVAALHPYDPHVLALPSILFAMLPPGVALLGLLGLAWGMWHPLRTFGLAWIWLLLFRLFCASGHGSYLGRFGDLAHFELFRYLMPLVPPLLLLAAIGWRHVLQPRVSRKVAAVVAMLCVVPPWPGAGALWPRSTASLADPGLPSVGWLDRNLQREVRFLMEQMDAAPECLFMTRVFPLGGRHETTTTFEWLLFRTRQWRLQTGQYRPPQSLWTVPGDGTAQALVASEAPDATCARFYRGLSCHRPGTRGCDEAIAGLTPLASVSFDNQPYMHPQHYADLTHEIRLEVYDVPVGSTP